MEKIKVINNSFGEVSARENGKNGILRTWPKEGDFLLLTRESIIAIASTPGGRKILTDFLTVTNEDILEELDIEVEQEYFYNRDTIKLILKEGTADDLRDVIEYAPKGLLDIIKNEMVVSETPDVTKREIFKETTGYDITNIIKNAKETSVLKSTGEENPTHVKRERRNFNKQD